MVQARWLFERQEAAALAEVEAARVLELASDEDEDPEDKPVKKASVKRTTPQQVHVWTLPDWKNPYGSDHRTKPLPQPSRQQRLDSVMRTIGHPLSIMRKWPEVLALKSECQPAPRKSTVMVEHKVIAAHRAALDKSIEKLAGRRQLVRTELDGLESELKALLAMRKAAGNDGEEEPEVEKPKRPKAKAQKAYSKKLAKASKKGGATGAGARALEMLAKDGATLTPATLAAETGQNPLAASQTLGKLARDKMIKRVSRGVYGAA